VRRKTLENKVVNRLNDFTPIKFQSLARDLIFLRIILRRFRRGKKLVMPKQTH